MKDRAEIQKKKTITRASSGLDGFWVQNTQHSESQPTTRARK